MTDDDKQALCDALAIADARYGQHKRFRADSPTWPAVWAWGQMSASIDRLTLRAARRKYLGGSRASA